MCGISGFCDFQSSSSPDILRIMTDVLQHRGPDDAGYAWFQTAGAAVGMGHRRLSILDLSQSGHQPMQFQHLTIIFNGEIYNFSEIRGILEKKGYRFQSRSDTEVLLKGFHCWGTDVLRYCIGMYAFAILDEQAQKLYLVRDRVGVKPLYYYWDDRLLLFASELKSFHAHPGFHSEIDPNALALFLEYSYIPAPYTIFRNTHKLLPGHIFSIDLATRETSLSCYWDVSSYYRSEPLDLSPEEILQHTEELMLSSYQYRMVADVPVGVFLSGGYDSTSVAALLQTHSSNQLKTFTIGFHEQAFNEAADAKAIASYLGTDHYEWYVTAADAEGMLSRIPEIYDEPFADNSVVPTILVSQFASREVKVVLSADGGDEIFGGYKKFNQSLYYTHAFPRWLQLSLSGIMKWISPDLIPVLKDQYNFSTRYEKMARIWKDGKPRSALKLISQYMTEKEVRTILTGEIETYPTAFDINGFAFSDSLNELLNIDVKTFLVDNNLVKVDRATMSVSIEGREPMLDHRLIEWLARIPGSMKIRNGINKYLLKQIVHKYIPVDLMDRPKRPFIAPLTIWFKQQLSDRLIEFVNEDALNKTGLFHSDPIIQLRDAYLSGKKINYQKIWQILVFQMWYQKWIAK
ncbi:MAG: asparagine synthase (glutamine-hydrolyzing) [Thermoflavifilum aggregans]|nr:asparagine synthase (glutamine-hydrolyzing) [Thermoflavifilum aggregans]